MFKHFDKIIIAECSAGQRKFGVDEGGRYICNNLNIIPDNILEKKLFNDINNEIENGYEILSNMLESDSSSGKKRILLIGGDHSLGISSVDYLLNKFQHKLRVLWIDAHADINDHITSITGNLHGMPLGYHHMSRTDKPFWRKNQYRLTSSQLYYFGIRDLDPSETELIEKENIGYSNKIDENLMKFIDESEMLLISFDVDALDPYYLDSTGCFAPNGLNPDDVKFVINYSIQQEKLIHLDIMEFNPHIGNVDKSIECIKNIFC